MLLYNYMKKRNYTHPICSLDTRNGHSTTLCIYKEVIRYYLDSAGVLYSCLLDASKAFDIVHVGKLFELLLKKNISKCIINNFLTAI